MFNANCTSARIMYASAASTAFQSKKSDRNTSPAIECNSLVGHPVSGEKCSASSLTGNNSNTTPRKSP